ncbi:MAG: MBL fold metallo-hydrolase [Candidatus Omnitrophica bacterium]|nr:MBL fold metallo-hydrolase [Candidatus Omnitrophota bacterium]
MFLEMIRSEGLAHLSYIFCDAGKAAVVDPRLDCEIYPDIAIKNEARITHIFETHRNEDYVTGSRELAAVTGAVIYHGDKLPFAYGTGVKENDSFNLGKINLRVIETPGHTYESISLVLTDTESSEKPLAVFTGDALFTGSTGRTDFFPDKKGEAAGLLYDSIFGKVLPLGDGVILYPAHGSGSVCGRGIASRDFSTIGFEKYYNPALQIKTKQGFIDYKTREKHYMPPYFKEMEKLNLEKRQLRDKIPHPYPLESDSFAQLKNDGAIILDIRSPEAFAGAYIPGSLAIPLDMISSFAGWFINYSKHVGLIVESREEMEKAVRRLFRMGYDKIPAYLASGLSEWETSGRKYDRIPAVHAGEIVRRITEKEQFILLDVRELSEYEESHLPGAQHLFLGELPGRLNEVARNKPVTAFCGTGLRAIIAASILKMHGFKEVDCCLGSMSACAAIGCPVKKGR